MNFGEKRKGKNKNIIKLANKNMYHILIEKVKDGEEVRGGYERISDTGNKFVRTTILEQNLDKIDLNLIIRAINDIK